MTSKAMLTFILLGNIAMFTVIGFAFPTLAENGMRWVRGGKWLDFTEEGGYFGRCDFLVIAPSEFIYGNSENFRGVYKAQFFNLRNLRRRAGLWRRLCCD